MPKPTMPVQAAPDVHTWGVRVREVAEVLGATALILTLLLRIGVAHVDRFLFGWLRRNPEKAKAEIEKLLDEHLAPLKDIPQALEHVARATRANARATREHTRSMSSFSERIAKLERGQDRLDERTKHITPET